MSRNKIGSKIKKMRTTKGISQMKFAELLGVTFQQIQKYESGINNVSLEKLKKISVVLKTPLSYFIGLDRPSYNKFEVLTAEEMRLVHHYRTIENTKIKQAIMEILNNFYFFKKSKKAQ